MAAEDSGQVLMRKDAAIQEYPFQVQGFLTQQARGNPIEADVLVLFWELQGWGFWAY